jgi:hypothetical protein
MTSEQLLLDKIMKRTCNKENEIVIFNSLELDVLDYVITLNSPTLTQQMKIDFFTNRPKFDEDYPGFSLYVAILNHLYPGNLLNPVLQSCDKWYGIAFKGKEDDGQNDCPLCKLYFYKSSDCANCPVRTKTRSSHCDNSPYQDTWFPLNRRKANLVVDTEVEFQAALDELYFLHTVLMDNLL